MNSYRNWKRITGTILDAMTAKVGDDDPRGPGIRIWFIDPSKDDIGGTGK